MKKRVLAIVLCIAVIAMFAVTFAACDKDDEDTATLKVGVILVGDETEGYTEAHMNGIEAAVAAIEASSDDTINITWKKKVAEDAACGTAIDELISAGCTVIISNSYGHQFYMAPAAQAHPNVTFIAMTGDFAAITPAAAGSSALATNFKNAFTKVFESRYVSGVVAGLKLQELVTGNNLTPNNMEGTNIKIGYVGAYNYAEVVSGYTSFYLGVKSVVPNVVMKVKYTNSWFDINKEKEAASALIADGCVIISQHADSEGAPTACEEAYAAGTQVYSVGYNVDMREASPHCALTSATNTWEVYYEYALRKALAGEAIATDWAEGYTQNAVAITDINTGLFTTNPTATITGVINQIKAGTLKVFDTSKFTIAANVNGEENPIVTDTNGHVTSYNYDMSYYDWSNGFPPTKVYQGPTRETIANGAFSESTWRSAPYFDLRIDGITEEAAPSA
jgi:Uncharacterized ABC-type transport system, periplasmic component/surface lipoprotein